MTVNQYDKIKLKTGEAAVVVEVLEKGKAYIADIERNGDYETETILHEEIKEIT
jgi:hypothetical protein